MSSPDTTMQQTAEAWGEILLERWLLKLNALGIGYSMQLEDSFRIQVIGSGMNVSQIHAMFNYYGKFVDMGVGKGVSSGEVKGVSKERSLIGRTDGTRRRAKKWYSPVFYTEVEKLKHILAEKYARRAVLTIVENVEDNAQKWVGVNV